MGKYKVAVRFVYYEGRVAMNDHFQLIYQLFFGLPINHLVYEMSENSKNIQCPRAQGNIFKFACFV